MTGANGLALWYEQQRISVKDKGQNDGSGHEDGYPEERHSEAKNSEYTSGWEKAAVGFEPTNNGFANRRLRPLGYAACETRVFYTSPSQVLQEEIVCLRDS